ncbi:hypothetical protein [Nonomuraea sp. NPDC049141]|uniref:hypothetical protein n=1 Tax=Nonomuraea sp. NPDC049141 TaxID=3155500 RepID=UPI0033DB9661
MYDEYETIYIGVIQWNESQEFTDPDNDLTVLTALNLASCRASIVDHVQVCAVSRGFFAEWFPSFDEPGVDVNESRHVDQALEDFWKNGHGDYLPKITFFEGDVSGFTSEMPRDA